MIPESVELVEGYRRRTLSPVEVTQAALDAIDTYDQRVNAFVLVDAEGALAAAKQSEARWHSGTPLGPGDGVPTSIKDALWTRGWPTLRGSTADRRGGPVGGGRARAWRGCGKPAPSCSERPRRRSTRGRASPTRRGTASPAIPGTPHDVRRIQRRQRRGGRARHGAVVGRHRRRRFGPHPCRVHRTVALKPTYGLIPLYPPSPFGTLSHAGPMTRTVRDTAALLDVITGFDARDWSAMPTPTSSFLDGLDRGSPACASAFRPTSGTCTTTRRLPPPCAPPSTCSPTWAPRWTRPIRDSPIRCRRSTCCGSPVRPRCCGPTATPGRSADASTRGCGGPRRSGATYSASDYLDATAVRMDSAC